jgi:hypothetical protein
VKGRGKERVEKEKEKEKKKKETTTWDPSEIESYFVSIQTDLTRK